MRKYVADFDPFKGSQAAHLAYLFSMLGNAYALLAQYEQEERQQEKQKFKEDIFEDIFEKRKGKE